MSSERSTAIRRYVLGVSNPGKRTAPLHYPLLGVLAVAAAVAPNTWFLPQQQGYYISIAVLIVIIIYGVLLTDIRLWTDTTFLLLFGGYWIGLAVQYHVTGRPELFQYVVVTPIAVYATVVVIPQLVDRRREAFAIGVTLLGVCASLFGLLLVLRMTQGEVVTVAGSSPTHIGQDVMGYDGFTEMRTVSVFHNPNTYGFFMMVSSLTALYVLLKRGGALWFLAFVICVLGLFMSEGDAAYLGFGVGALIVLSGYHRWLALVGLGVGLLGIYAMIRIGHIPHVMQSTLMSRVNNWVLSLERLAEDPLWGIGFVDAAPEIGSDYGPHNSFVHALLNAGIVVGSLYLGALAYALARGIRRRWTRWTGFIVGTTVGLFTYMFFESLFLGGLSVASVVLGTLIGLLLLPEADRLDSPESPSTLMELRRSRLGRFVERLRTSPDRSIPSYGRRGEE